MTNRTYTHNFGTHNHYQLGVLASKRLNQFFSIDRCKTFVETGTNTGNGVQWAIDSNMFQVVMSTEIHEGAHAFCCERFKHENRVGLHLHKKDTLQFLREIVSLLNDNTLIYLDAHYSNNPYATCIEEYPVPLILESQIILNEAKDLSKLMVVIDDERLWDDEMIERLIRMYTDKGMIDFYVDDSIVFCDKSWIKR
jgi:hypothetical protein